MGVFKRGRVYWYEFQFLGVRVRETSHSRSKDVAVSAERERRRNMELAANGLQPQRRPIRFERAVEEWMKQKRAGWSKSYLSIQTYNLQHLLPTFNAKLLNEITPALIGEYQGDRKDEGASNRTINMEVSTLRMIMGIFDLWTAIAKKVKMLPEREDVGKALEPEQAERLLEACFDSAQPSLYPAVVIFCNAGLRNAELRRARWAQVNLSKAEFEVGKTKTEGGSGRIVPLNRPALEAFEGWRARWPNAKPTDFIFPSEKLVFKGKGSAKLRVMTAYDTDFSRPIGSWKKAWNTALKAAGVECRIHDLRHHFITALAESGASDSTILAVAGHLSRKMMERYSHVRNAAKRRAVDAVETTISKEDKD